MKYDFFDIGQSRRPYLLTVLGGEHVHPLITFRASNALYVGTGDLAYTVVDVASTTEPFAESHWANVAEIRLWGALAFAIREGEGFYSFKPVTNRMMYLSSINEQTCHRVAEKLASEVPKTEGGWTRNLTVPETEIAALYEALLKADNILLRGVSCYLKSHLFWGSTLFMEEKAFNLYVSLEAALNTLKRRFSAEQKRDVSYEYVYEFLDKTFTHGPGLVEYLKDCRDDRNILFHPDNYFGEYVMAPMSADDIMELFDPMLSLYRYILIGDAKPARVR